jgi:hypothetical protein
MRLRARVRYTSSTLIGGKGGAGPSSLLHTTLEGPTKGVCECKTDVKSNGFLHGIKWIMFHGHLDYFQKPPLGGRPHTKSLGANGTPNTHNCCFILFYHVWRPAWIEIHWNSIWLRAVIHDFTLHLRVHDHTTWFWRCLGTASRHFLSGSHNFMVTALGSCAKWPSHCWLVDDLSEIFNFLCMWPKKT